eukprot:1196286-Prorocentrum_minimum.AAC.1
MSTTDFDGNTFAGNTFKLSITEDGEHASGVPYTTGVTYTADLVTIEVDDSTPSPLYYYSVENSGYGGKILIDHAGLGVADGSDSGGYAEATYFHIEVLPDAEGDKKPASIEPGWYAVVQVIVYAHDGAAHDRAGNPSVMSNSLTFLFDTTNPTVNLNTTSAYEGVGNVGYGFAPETNVSPIPLTISFGEDVTDFTVADLVLAGAVSVDGGAFTASTGPSVWTLDLVPSGEGTIELVVPFSSAQDAATNVNQVSNTLSIVFDTTQPTVTLTHGASTNSDVLSLPTKKTNTYPIPVTATFSEHIAEGKFVEADFTLDSCTTTDFVAGLADWSYLFQAATEFTVGLVPDTDEAELYVEVAGAVATDTAGNDNTASGRITFLFDSTPPTVVITHNITTTGIVTRFSPNTMNITFSEPVYGFTVDDVNATNAVKSDFLGGDGDSFFQVNLAPETEDFVTVVIASNNCQDEATNGNTVSNTVIYRYDVSSPLVSVLNSEDIIFDHAIPGPVSNVLAMTITLTFNEPVIALTIDDLIVTAGNASLSALVETVVGGSLDRDDWTFTLEPHEEGLVSVQFPGGVATDDAGNVNVASNVLSFTWDTTQPVGTFNSTEPETVAK